MVVNPIHEDCWRSLKYTRFTFSTGLKAGFVGVLIPAKLTSPAVPLLVTKTQAVVARFERRLPAMNTLLMAPSRFSRHNPIIPIFPCLFGRVLLHHTPASDQEGLALVRLCPIFDGV